MIGVLGAYQTKFGELWGKSLMDLAEEAGERAIKDSGVDKKEIDWVLVGNKLSGRLDGQEHLGSLVSERLGLKSPGVRVEAACASGGVAIHQAVMAVRSGRAKKVLVIGVEKMTDQNNGEIARSLMAAASEAERRVGLSFVGLYGLMARAYLNRYSLEEKDLAKIAVANHKNACLNPKAHFQREISVAQVMNSPMVSSPLKMLDCSPISDGAAAVVVSRLSAEDSRREAPEGVEIVASQMAGDSLSLSHREDLTELRSTQVAGENAYREAGVKAKNIDIIEVHDCFTVAQAIALEDLGLAKRGEGFKSSRLAVNTSGGLKACGHPVGATGVKQVVEITEQLRGRAGKRQVRDAKIGMTHNVGGTGGTAVVHILRKI